MIQTREEILVGTQSVEVGMDFIAHLQGLTRPDTTRSDTARTATTTRTLVSEE